MTRLFAICSLALSFIPMMVAATNDTCTAGVSVAEQATTGEPWDDPMKRVVIDITSSESACSRVTVEFLGGTLGVLQVDGAHPAECLGSKLCSFEVKGGSRRIETVHTVVDEELEITTDKFFRCQICGPKASGNSESTRLSLEEREAQGGDRRVSNTNRSSLPYAENGPYVQPSPYGKAGIQTIRSEGRSTRDYLRQNQSLVEAAERAPPLGVGGRDPGPAVSGTGSLTKEQCSQLMQQVLAYDEVIPAYQARSADPAVRNVYKQAVRARNANADMYNNNCN